LLLQLIFSLSKLGGDLTEEGKVAHLVPVAAGVHKIYL
jgi:hypothetical protein